MIFKPILVFFLKLSFQTAVNSSVEIESPKTSILFYLFSLVLPLLTLRNPTPFCGALSWKTPLEGNSFGTSGEVTMKFSNF